MAKRHGPRTPVVLIVLDGWGFRPGQVGNAIELGRTPTWHRLWAKAPRTLLNASGLAVGLPESQIGNSEVGHLNLDRKSTRLNSSHSQISYAVFCLKKKKRQQQLYQLQQISCDNRPAHSAQPN